MNDPFTFSKGSREQQQLKDPSKNPQLSSRMSEHPWEGHIPDQTARVLVTGSAFVICFGLANRFLKETLYLGEPLLATILGSILGPYAINLLNCTH